jgi:hypothetical protein
VRRLLASCAALLVVACARPAPAQVAGQFGPAVPLAVNQHAFGVYAALAQHQAEALGQMRLSFYPGVDFGFQGGLRRFDTDGPSRTAVELGGDLRTQVARRAGGAFADVALGGAIQLSSADHRNALSLGPTLAASRSYTLNGGATLSPYAGLALLFTRTDRDGDNTTDLSCPLRGGLEYQPNAGLRLVAELQLPLSDPQGSHPKFVLGANFPF